MFLGDLICLDLHFVLCRFIVLCLLWLEVLVVSLKLEVVCFGPLCLWFGLVLWRLLTCYLICLVVCECSTFGLLNYFLCGFD